MVCACHTLVRLDVSHAKMVTDVGVASLSSGCPNLRHVNFHGVSECGELVMFCLRCIYSFVDRLLRSADSN